MVEPVFRDGVWVCPVCGFMAMTRKVVEQHIQREHPLEASKKEGSKETSRQKNRKGGVSKRSFKLGRTEVRLWDYEHLDVRDQRSWLMFQNRNYVAGLHKKRVRVKLVSGEEFEGLLKARDPYFVSLVIEGGPIYINKAHILWIRPIQEGD